MSILIFASRKFERSSESLPKKIKENLKDRIEIFVADPFARVLNNHRLKGHLRNYRSINITGDYRVIYEQYDDDTVKLIDVGTHHQLFGK